MEIQSEIIAAIKSILGIALEEASKHPDVVTGLVTVKEGKAKYALDGDTLIGLNLFGCKMTDPQWGEIVDSDWFHKDKIRALNLGSNDLEQLKFSKEYAQLEQLHISDCKKLRKVSFEEGLPNLKRMHIRDNESLKRIEVPEGFADLKYLELSRNALDRIEFEGDMSQTEWLALNDNQLQSVIFKGNLHSLLYLNCRNNNLGELSFNQLPSQLNMLDLQNNALEDLPERSRFLEMEKLELLYLSENPIREISEEIIGVERNNSIKAIVSYLKSGLKSELIPLREAKMVLVGNGMVGKTSIRYRLIDKEKPEDEKRPFPTDEERTELLEVEKFYLKNIPTSISNLDKPVDFCLNIWDYGGQGHYREVQQFFCSKKTLYLYVTAPDDVPQNEEKEDYYIGYQYWLSMVQAYGYDAKEKHPSPIICVLNKIDNKIIGKNESAGAKTKEIAIAKENFSNVHELINVSSRYGYNFKQLEEAIPEILTNISKDIFEAKYSTNWLDVKRELEQLKESKPHISMNDYLEICGSRLEKEEAVEWLKILDRIGAIKYFEEDDNLQNWIILDPDWLRRQIHKAINGKPIKDGVISETKLKENWEEDWEKMIQVMRYFRLCYKQEDDYDDEKFEYVFPSRFYRKQPPLPSLIQGTAQFKVKFNFTPFIPAGIVNKLMVELHKQIYKKLKWLNNFVIEDDKGNHAHIFEEWKEQCIYVKFFGENPQELFILIMKRLEEIKNWFVEKQMMHHLTFSIKAECHNKWYSPEELKSFGEANYNWLWDMRMNFKENIETENNNFSEKIRELAAKNKLEKAIELCMNEFEENETYINEIVTISGRLENWNSEKQKGFKPDEAILNEIRYSIISLVSDYGNS